MCYAEGNTVFDKSYCENVAMILQVFSKCLCTKNNKREVDNCRKCTKEFQYIYTTEGFVNTCIFFSFALEKSVGIYDTAQLSMFLRQIHGNFNVSEDVIRLIFFQRHI